MTNAEARFNNSLRLRKPEGSLGRTAQDVHLDSHTAPELCRLDLFKYSLIYSGGNLWNNLPLSIKILSDHKALKKIKQDLMETITTNID